MRTPLPFLGACVLLVCSTSWAQSQPKVAYLKSPPGTVCYLNTTNANTFVDAPLKYRQTQAGARTKTATINVTYEGFTQGAQDAFEAAVNIWESLLVTDVQINILARWAPLGEGVLGSASAGSYIMNFDGAPRTNIWYPIPLAEKLAGKELNGEDPDIVATFSSARSDWHFGLDGTPPPPNTYDLMTVVLHEIGHGLGITNSYEVSGSEGVISSFFSGRPLIYEVKIESATGENLMSSFDLPSEEMGTILTTGLFYDDPLVLGVNSGQRGHLYAPNEFDGGSSVAHLDEFTYLAGTANSLMTPAISPAERNLSPGPIVSAILKDMGWLTTFVNHTPVQGSENATDPIDFVCSVTSDIGFDADSVTVHYSIDGGEFTVVKMTPTGTPNEFKTTISNTAATYKYFISVIDDDDRAVTKPGLECKQGEEPVQSVFTFETGPDTKPPFINHVPLEFMNTFDTLRIEAVISDNLGVLEASVELDVNGTPLDDVPMTLKPDTDSTYVQSIIFPEGSLNDGDKVHYRITAKDKSVAGNVRAIPSPTTFYEVNVTGLQEARDFYFNDFNDLSEADFFGTGFSVIKPAGFADGAIHSDHPYQEGTGSPSDHLNFTYQLRFPVRVAEVDAHVKFDEIVLVEPGEVGAPFGSDDFYDYVVVEGSKDGGITWTPLADGYDARDKDEWLEQYNSSMDGQISTAQGTPALYRPRTLNLQSRFDTDDVVAIRFRLYSDPLAAGWGWSIDNLNIQLDLDAPVIKHQHVDFVLDSDAQLNLVAKITDGGLDSIAVEYKINNGSTIINEVVVNPGQTSYSESIDINSLVAGDELSYRIYARDKTGNEGFYPTDGFLKVVVVSFDAPLDFFETDFTTVPEDVAGNYFSIAQPAGFANKAVHSVHPYLANIGPNASSSNFTWMITRPFKVNAASPFIQFDEIVITEYQGSNPVDYLVVEASKDGVTWEALVPKHAANFSEEWKTAYDQNQTGSISLFKTRFAKILESGTFKVDDLILVRFRLFSSAANTGWGVVIDNLSIQGPVVGVTEIDEDFSVYPNPVAGNQLQLRFAPGRNSDASFQIVNLQGQEVHDERFVAASDVVEHPVDVGNLPGGLYLVRVRTQKGLLVNKFIKLN